MILFLTIALRGLYIFHFSCISLLFFLLFYFFHFSDGLALQKTIFCFIFFAALFLLLLCHTQETCMSQVPALFLLP